MNYSLLFLLFLYIYRLGKNNLNVYFRFDRGLGGTEITLRLRRHLAKVFNGQKKTKTDVFTNERSMGKLFKEAEKLKKVLSANTHHYAQVCLNGNYNVVESVSPLL